MYSGNIDQAQYCDKIKGIVDFLGTDLSSDELTMIWKMQVKKMKKAGKINSNFWLCLIYRIYLPLNDMICWLLQNAKPSICVMMIKCMSIGFLLNSHIMPIWGSSQLLSYKVMWFHKPLHNPLPLFQTQAHLGMFLLLKCLINSFMYIESAKQLHKLGLMSITIWLLTLTYWWIPHYQCHVLCCSCSRPTMW